MSAWTTQVWVAIIGAVAAVAGVIGNRTGNRADAATKLSDGALKQVASMREDLNHERERGDRLETLIEAVHRDAAEAIRRVEAEQRREREWCDARINQLVRSLHAEGIEVPPPPTRD